MKITLRIALVLMVTLLWASIALAAKSVMVLPFTVNAPEGYKYLGQAVPSTLSTRLMWPGHIDLFKSTTDKAPTSAAAAAQIQKSTGADYVAWGEVNVLNNNVTLNVTLRDKSGKEWKRTGQSTVGNIVGAVQSVADGLSTSAFGRPARAQSTPMYSGGGQGPVNQMNAGIVINETTQQGVYLNPQFRYQGSGTEDGSRLRSKALPYNMVDFVAGDFSGNGRTEIAVLGDHHLYVYDWNNGAMQEKASVSLGLANQAFILRKIALDGRGEKLVVSTFGEGDNRPLSYIYAFDGSSLREYVKPASYFLNVVPMAPSFKPTLVAQSWDSLKLFRAGVHLANTGGGAVTLGGKINLPSGTNLYSFAWLPAGNQGDGNKLLVFSPEERITVYGNNGKNRMHQTMDKFSGSSVGMEHYKGIEGLGVDKRYQIPSHYYAPMRLNIADLEGRGEYVVLINKPVSTASEIFENYRMYPQGEIHALYWDGVGLGLKWKTRRIRGSVVNSDLGDLNNDGIIDLIVGLNTHPGAMGVGSRKGVIMAYPLDLSQSNPNTAPDISDFESGSR